MARWLEEIDGKLNALTDAQINSEVASREMKSEIAELARTVNQFLKARSDGGPN